MNCIKPLKVTLVVDATQIDGYVIPEGAEYDLQIVHGCRSGQLIANRGNLMFCPEDEQFVKSHFDNFSFKDIMK